MSNFSFLASSYLTSNNSSSNSIIDLINFILGLGGFVIFLLLVVQVVFIVICVKIAKSKGYGALGWGLAGFVFGFIALIVLLCLPDLAVSYSNPSWICKHCGQIYYNPSSKCFNCGNDRCSSNSTPATVQSISKPTQPISKPKQPTQPQTQKVVGWICPKCKEENNANAHYCINCYTKKP
ncbi:MAG: hypothetical protein J6R29_07480 [Clostridia bacterium]|nr:hypothetical protein [Clostridia bacterium]